MTKGNRILDGLRDAVAGNFAAVTIEGQRWIRLGPDAPSHIQEWIAYADKLEAALKLACGQTTDRLMRMHAEQGLRIVRPSVPDNSLTDPSDMGIPE